MPDIIKNFVKSEWVLCVAAVCAGISMIFAPPSAAYAGYINIRILCLLFCLMALISGFRKCGIFKLLAQSLLSRRKRLRGLSLTLILLPFFCSMFITNDVALITFVPFTILVLTLVNRMELAVPLISLQTIAANLGSMATPFGNPQNLFLYADYGISPAGFLAVMAPLTAASLIGLCLSVFLIKDDAISVHFTVQERLEHPGLLPAFALLFVLSLLSVFRLVHYALLTALVAGFLLIFSRDLLRQVDYGLLATFVCFFIFAGNIGNIPAVRVFLSSVMERGALFTSILASQIVSNVPAAVLLANFTENWRALLSGVNIGGLGTPIASLASLISLKIYMKSEAAKPARYLAFFTASNAAGLAILTALAVFLLRL